MKKLWMAALCALLLAGCMRQPPLPYPSMRAQGPAVESVAAQERTSVRVAYLPDDPLNPYLSRTGANRDLALLLYDAPVRLGPDFQPEYDLAQAVEVSGVSVNVRLRQGVRFWSGAPLTARDAAYSLSLCVGSDPRYANIAAYAAADEHTLAITLARPDIWIENLLTFPVIPDQSGGESVPPGTGRFCPADGKLVRNASYHGEASAIGEIALEAVEAEKEIGYRLMSGQLDAARLEPDSSPMETAGSFPIQTNDMIFLGFNATLAPADDARFRRAVSLLCDRDALARDAFGGRAAAAAGPVNPVFFPRETPTPDPEAAATLLDELGYSARDGEGCRVSAAGRPLEVQLCFNVESAGKREAAQLLARQLGEAGVRVALGEYTYDDYLDQVRSGGYHLYLGQTRLPEDMALDAFLAAEGSLHFALGDTSALYERYLAARRGEEDYAAFLSAFGEQAPLAPLAFRQSVLAHARNFYSAVVATEQDIFYNIHKW